MSKESAIDSTQLAKKIRFIAPKSQKSEIDSTHVSTIVGLPPKSQKSTGAIAPSLTRAVIWLFFQF